MHFAVKLSALFLLLQALPTVGNAGPVYRGSGDGAKIQSLFLTSIGDFPQGHIESQWAINKCSICQSVIEPFHLVLKANITKECLQNFLAWLCEHFSIQSGRICKLIVSEFKDEVLYVANELLLNPNQLCGLLFKNCGTPANPFYDKWTIEIPGNKPPVTPVLQPRPNYPRLRILHISDIHFDTEYEPGTEAHCTEPICCRRDTQHSRNVSLAAGYWGTLSKCDIPLRTLENMFQHISRTDRFDMIYWTGDLASHADWTYTKDGHIRKLQTLAKLFAKYFPTTRIYSALGNHEGVPINSFPPEFVPKKYGKYWLTENLATIWGHSLENTTVADIKFRASYVTKPFPGLRIISLNTLYCEVTNFWLYLNLTDPDGTLAWFRDQLLDAERHGEKVHIIGHIASGNAECLTAWSENYYKLVNRFESTIAGQFFGHTHLDDFKVYYDKMTYPGRPTGVVYLAPSVTTFSDLHPSYRTYTVDGNYKSSSWTVLNHETYWMNMTEANLLGEPVWRLEYDARRAYGMDSLQPQNWNDLIETMLNDNVIFNRYQKHRTRGRVDKCDKYCRHKLLCYLRSSISDDSRFCHGLLETQRPLWVDIYSIRSSNKTPKNRNPWKPIRNRRKGLPDDMSWTHLHKLIQLISGICVPNGA